MSIGTRVYNILMSLVAIAALVSCSGAKSKSQAAAVEVLPPKPIVITGPTLDGKGTKVEGPWFNFRMKMTNSTTESITIVALELEVIGQGSSGQPESKTVSFAPSEYNFSLNENTECKYTGFGTWAVGESKAFTLTGASVDCPTVPVFIVGSNTKGASGRNYRYRVRAKPLGWFGTADEATDRFEKTITFFTQ